MERTAQVICHDTICYSRRNLMTRTKDTKTERAHNESCFFTTRISTKRILVSAYRAIGPFARETMSISRPGMNRRLIEKMQIRMGTVSDREPLHRL